MKRFVNITLSIVSLLALAACHDVKQWDNDPYGNFDALWTIIDEHYCFFAYKDVDWQQVGQRYRAKLSKDMTQQELFDVCSHMLMELRDGHTNLISSTDVSRYWIWEQYPENFSLRVVTENYLNFDYKNTSGIRYQILPQNIGYMYYGSFSNAIGEGNLDAILYYLSSSDGLIIDVRSNGGGYLPHVETLVSRFISERTYAGAISHKTGPGHDDFSEPYHFYYKPAHGRIHYTKPVVVLANRASFSATNNFVSIMKSLQNVTVIGDVTGGGSGLPITNELPCGWTVRFSSCSITDPAGNITEFGTEPDIRVDITAEDAAAGRDTILETAIGLLTGSAH